MTDWKVAHPTGRVAASYFDCRLLAFVLCAFVALSACSPTEPRPPKNLILVSIDTLVPGRMSLYGGPRNTTPRIDALAAKSVRFDNAFSPAPWTLPAHASMLTGLYPSNLTARPGREWTLGRSTLLSGHFQRAGYKTSAVTGGGFCGQKWGINRGFDSFEEVLRGPEEANAIDNSIAWLESNGSQPFFLFFHSFIAHEPYLDRRYVRPGQGENLENAYLKDPVFWLEQICCQDMQVSENEREFMLALYDGGIAAADEMLGRLLDALDELDLLDSTAIIITSDHGQEFWQHTDRGGHGHSLYDEQLRVPLLWYEPGMHRPGSVVSAAVSLIDLVPTALARFGVEGDETLDGVDLSPLIDRGSWAVTRPLYAEAIHHGPKRASIRTDKGKLIVTREPDKQIGIGRKYPVSVASAVELFLPEDLAELNNVGEHPDVLEFRSELEDKLEAHRTFGGVDGPGTRLNYSDADILDFLSQRAERLKQGEQEQPSEFELPELDEETRKQLRNLGYLE